MSTVRTSVPIHSYRGDKRPRSGSGGRGGGGGSGGGGGGGGRPKPPDNFSIVDLGVDEAMRRMFVAFLTKANLGTPPNSRLVTSAGARTLTERMAVVEPWVEGLLNAPNGLKAATFSHLAEAFVHVLHAVNQAGTVRGHNCQSCALPPVPLTVHPSPHSHLQVCGTRP